LAIPPEVLAVVVAPADATWNDSEEFGYAVAAGGAAGEIGEFNPENPAPAIRQWLHAYGWNLANATLPAFDEHRSFVVEVLPTASDEVDESVPVVDLEPRPTPDTAAAAIQDALEGASDVGTAVATCNEIARRSSEWL